MSGSEDEGDWSDVVHDEMDEVENSATCLFCVETFSTIDICFAHIINNHDINMEEIIKKKQMDFYIYIKFINYTRENKLPSTGVSQLEVTSYEDEKWLIPVLENDLLLQFDVDSVVEEPARTGNSDLIFKLGIAEERATLAEEFLERTLDDLNKCRLELGALLLGKTSVESKKHVENESEGYFSSYAHYGIHEEMLKDKVRTQAYQNFIVNNPNIFKNARVLDVGCGTSVLSMFAARAGASKVIAVDNSDVAYQAIDIVRENKLDAIIEVKKGKAEDINLNSKVDVIISEWMGYFLLFESMLNTVLYCRDHYLSEHGCIYPDKCNIQLVALCDNLLYDSKVRFWDNVYGFKMTTMKSGVLEEPLVTIVDADKIMSEACILEEFDLMKISLSQLDIDKGFDLKVTKSGACSALVGYFDVNFHRNAENPVLLSTGVFSPPTHWKQTVFFLKSPLQLKVGDVLKGRMICKKNKLDHRALDIAIFLYDDKDCILSRQHYVLG